MSSSVRTSRASATGRPAGRPPGGPLAEATSMRPRRRRRPRACHETACAPRAAPSARSWPRSQPRPRSRTAAPAAGRCRARKSRACMAGDRIVGIEHRRKLARISAQSSTVMVPSGRSAMICTVVPLRPETQTRPGGSPDRQASARPGRNLGGQAGLANKARLRRRPLTASVPRRFECVSRSSGDRPKQKERTPRAHSQS